MNKRIFNWMLMAALVVGFGTTVTACSDDDDDKDGRSTEEIAQDPYEKESEAATALYRLVSQLSVCDSLPNDWKTATFEPKVGKVLDQSQPRIRTIAVNDAAEAVARYNSLTGKDLSAATQSDTYKVDGVGTLQLNVGGAGTIATIDVDVKQLPQLQQLRLVSVANMGENGSFKGEPYYRFGDVVKDKKGHYWICVRPAFSPNGKEDTHWMSFQVDDENVTGCQRGKCNVQLYAVDLGVNKEKMQYLAQLMAIMANPKEYKKVAGDGNFFNGTGLGGLRKDAMYVDELVLQAKLWEQFDVWDLIAPTEVPKTESVEAFKKRFQQGLTFIYEKCRPDRYSLLVPTVTYSYSDGKGFYSSEPYYETVTIDMKEVAFDIRNRYIFLGIRGDNSYPVPDAFVVRYKTGFQLSSNWLFNPSPTDAIPGVTTVHRFDERRDEVVVDEEIDDEDNDDDDDDDEVIVTYTKEQAKPGMVMGSNGKFYADKVDCENAGTKAVAMVAYVGDNVDTSGNYHGLAMSYFYVSDIQWDESTQIEAMCTESVDPANWADQKDGIERTKKLAEDGHKHSAAQRAWNFKVKNFDPAKYGFSNWFLPTMGQVIMAVRGLGGTANYSARDGWSFTLNNDMEDELREIGAYRLECWTSTESDSENAVMFLMDDMKLKTYNHRKYLENNVSPFIAF